MKIASDNLQMASYHMSYREHTVCESFRMWTGQHAGNIQPTRSASTQQRDLAALFMIKNNVNKLLGTVRNSGVFCTKPARLAQSVKLIQPPE